MPQVYDARKLIIVQESPCILIYLVKVDVIIEGDDRADPTAGAEPRDCVPADGEENHGHVELEGLGGPFGGAEAVTHDLERHPVPVLNELPREQCHANRQPEGHDPRPPPVRPEQDLGPRHGPSDRPIRIAAPAIAQPGRRGGGEGVLRQAELE